jgi:hypothetical protein
METQLKTSGDKQYVKIIGTPSELNRVAHRTHEPIKPASGSNPSHVDVPKSKINRLKEGE